MSLAALALLAWFSDSEKRVPAVAQQPSQSFTADLVSGTLVLTQAADEPRRHRLAVAD
jgi:hypothetical protein